MTSIVDPFSRAVNLTYASGLLSSISDFAGKLWTMADTNGELVSLTEPDPGGGSPVWQFGYTGNYLTSEADPDSNVSSFVLDAYHRLAQTDLPGGGNTADTTEQDFGYGSTSQGNPGSLTLESSVTPSGTDAMGNKQSFQTDVFGDTISQTDSYGNTTATQRDANGLPTVITQPPPAAGDASPVTTVSYDTLGNELSATGAGYWGRRRALRAARQTTIRAFDGRRRRLRVWRRPPAKRRAGRRRSRASESRPRRSAASRRRANGSAVIRAVARASKQLRTKVRSHGWNTDETQMKERICVSSVARIVSGSKSARHVLAGITRSVMAAYITRSVMTTVQRPGKVIPRLRFACF